MFARGPPPDRRRGEGVPVVFPGGAETLPPLDRGWGEGGPEALLPRRMFAGRPRRRREKA